MKRVFVDTSFLVAFHHAKDPFHDRARQVMTERLAEYHPLRLIITDYVFDEFVTVMQKAGSRKVASELGDLLLKSSQVDFHWIGEKGFEGAWEIFLRFKDKLWSFTDCTSYLWITQNQPDFMLATDPDFDQFGLIPNLART